MEYVYATLLGLVNPAFLASVAIGLPGNWLIVAATGAFAWWRWDEGRPADEQVIGVVPLIVMAGLALIAEGLEMFSGLVGAKKAGGSKWGALGALAGTIVGGIAGTFLIPVPIVGSIVGACAGAAAGAGAMEYASGRSVDASTRSAAGAGVGRFAGILVKFGLGAVIWCVATVAAFWN